MGKIKSDRVGNISIISGNPVFIPHKLYPNGPEINISLDLFNLLDEAARALGELKGITETLPDPDLFVAFYVRKEALLSSQIEGTQCSLDEVIQVDEKTSEVEPVAEVVNYINAMNYGLENLSTLPISKRLIHNIHKKLLEGVRGREKTPGEYKHAQNWIGPPGSKIEEAEYIPPAPHMMEEYMSDFEKYYHEDHKENKFPPLIETAILHSYFETIHPYADGNGRLGRLLITFMLCERKILDKPLLYLSLFFKENKSHYYDLLMNVRLNGEWEEWIKFFLRGVRNTSLEAIRTANEIKSLQEKDRNSMLQESSHKIAIQCFDLICRYPIISISVVVKKLNSNYPSIKRVFDDLIRLGILEYHSTKRRKKIFSYAKYLQILRRGT